MKRNTIFDKFKIKALQPDLPRLADLTPLLTEIDESRWYSNFGPLNDRFEKRILSEFDWGIDTPHCSTANNATLALRLAMQSEGLKPGDRVLIPAVTFPATLLCIQEAGLIPVIADVDPDLWELTPAIARAAMDSFQLAAVMPVTVFGYPINVAPWQSFVEETGLRVILDAAPAFGHQKVAPNVSAVFSLHATKPLGIGEGGLYVCSDADAIATFRNLSNFGFDMTRGLVATQGGTNAKLPEMLAAVGLLQLERKEAISKTRQTVLDRYRAGFDNMPVSFRVGTDSYVPATLMVDVGERKAEFQQALKENAIQSRDWYLPPMHRHPAFEGVERTGALLVSEDLEQRLMGLPFHSFLNEDDVDAVIAALQSAL